MNLQSKISFIVGVFLFMATCSGQQPSDKEPLKHFVADIMKVDSILCIDSHINKQKIRNNPIHNVKCDGTHIRFELNKDIDGWNECSVCPLISEIIRPNERDE